MSSGPPDLTAWQDDTLTVWVAALREEQTRRRVLDTAGLVAERAAADYAAAVEGAPPRQYEQGMVVGPGEVVIEAEVHWVNTSGAWLHTPPSVYPLGWSRWGQDAPDPDEVPMWEPDTNYAADEDGTMPLVTCPLDGQVYMLVQPHTALSEWEPSRTPALWTLA